MLMRRHRFHGHNSLNFVYKRGQTVRGPQIAVRYIRNANRQDYRLAVIVSKKVHKSAVERNRLRRRIYEIVRTGKPITQPYDIVITIFTERISTLSPEELTRLITDLLHKAGVYAPARPAPTSRAIVESREEH